MKQRILFTAIVLMMIACSPIKQSENFNFPSKLIGVETHYTYSGGNSYAVKLEEEGLSYQYRSGGSPEKWWGPFKYNHMITDNNEHFVSWFEPGYGDYVTLLINFENKTIYGSAIIKGEYVHFQKADIHKTIKP